MAEKNTRRATSQREAVAKIREAETIVMNLPICGQVKIPRPEHLAYYGGLAALAALELIDWPVALVIATGHILANNHHNRVLEELGEAMKRPNAASGRPCTPAPRCASVGVPTRERTPSALRGRLGAVDRTNLTG